MMTKKDTHLFILGCIITILAIGCLVLFLINMNHMTYEIYLLIEIWIGMAMGCFVLSLWVHRWPEVEMEREKQ